MQINTLSIVIPVYNEEDTVIPILEKVAALQLIEGIQKELIIVNDASKDATDARIKEFQTNYPNTKLVYKQHDVNQGKGAAIATGVKEATGDYIVIQDADLEYNPQEINELLEPVIHFGAHVVYGSRFTGNKLRSVKSFKHYWANKFLTYLANIMAGLSFTDMETCYKLIDSKVFKGITIQEKRFGLEPEITMKLAKQKHLKFYEVGISYHARGLEEGKKIGFKDGLRAIYCIFKYA